METSVSFESEATSSESFSLARTSTQELILAVQQDRAASRRKSALMLGALVLLFMLGGSLLRPPPAPASPAPGVALQPK